MTQFDFEFNENDYRQVIQTALPQATRSYAPVAHSDVINTTLEQLDKSNLSIKSMQLNHARDGQQLIGYFDLAADTGDSELGFRLGFRNSYDKSMSVAFLAGNQVFICSNGMIAGEIQFLRKHTGSVVQEMNDKIHYSIEQLEAISNKAIAHKEAMKLIKVDKTTAAELAGRMFIEQDIIALQQLSIIKKELFAPSYDYNAPETLWELYNHTTHSFKKSHPLEYIQRHKNLHTFMETEYNL